MKIMELCAVDFTAYHLLRPLGVRLREAGHEVTFCCSSGEGLDLLADEGFHVIPISFARSYNVFRHVKSLTRLVRYLRRERFEAVHVHTPVAGLIGRVAARIASVPLVVYTAHGFYFHEGMHRLVRRFFIMLEKYGGRFTDLTFVQSKEDWQEAIREKVAPEERLVYIGNGVDPARFGRMQYEKETGNLRRELDVDGSPVIGFIGRIVREKGPIEFVEAAASIKRVFPDARFVMVGAPLESDRDGCWREVHHLRQRLSLEDSLVLTGYRRDIPALLSLFDIFVLPSYREGMPRVLLEAMATGIPVVATDIRGCREEVVDGVTGLLVPPRDSGALSEAVVELITREERAAAMGAAGRERVVELFNERRIIEIQVGWLERLFRDRVEK